MTVTSLFLFLTPTAIKSILSEKKPPKDRDDDGRALLTKKPTLPEKVIPLPVWIFYLFCVLLRNLNETNNISLISLHRCVTCIELFSFIY